MVDADSQKGQRFAEGQFSQEGRGQAETNVKPPPWQWHSGQDDVMSFYNRWGMWIPLEGRGAFLDQLKRLVERPDL